MMLILATTGFTLCFRAWALLAPLGPRLRDDLGLTSSEQSLVVAVPVVVGALGRIPAGALTDRWGARRVFPVVAALTVSPCSAWATSPGHWLTRVRGRSSPSSHVSCRRNASAR
ncbi:MULTISPECIES: MFS transporter [unclassified Streptomyces]|uniref:MFS transporter n=1 Tax=unclassified Streptomyces TaxID=2593676 RepID=UPI001F0D63EE|nr:MULTISPECIES: MFS transporter [unclassified Streptomyces]